MGSLWVLYGFSMGSLLPFIPCFFPSLNPSYYIYKKKRIFSLEDDLECPYLWIFYSQTFSNTHEGQVPFTTTQPEILLQTSRSTNTRLGGSTTCTAL